MSDLTLDGKTCFLHLSGWVLNGELPVLEGLSSFEDAIKKWNHSSRLSPLFPFAGSVVPDFGKMKKVWVCFFGPVFPGKLATYNIESLHLTLGIYNLVAFAKTAAQKNQIRKIAKQLHTGWEIWQIENGRVVDVDHWQPYLGVIDDSFLTRARKRPSTVPIKDSSREYTTQMATAHLRAKHYWPEFATTLEEFDDYFTSLLKAAKESRGQGAAPQVSSFHDLYVMANAALSQQTEQAYTGVSPILETRGHYSMHSLLGIGIASRALQNLTAFIHRAFAQAAFLERVEKLSALPPHGTTALCALATNDALFDEDPLSDTFLHLEKGSLKADETSPCLSFFSVRDGFRNKLLTVSAPFEVTISANTRPWTLQTLTHEITHILMRAVLEIWMPPATPTQLAKALDLMAPNSKYQTLGDQLTEWICLAAHQMDDSPLATLDAESLGQCLQRHRQEIDEILTHCFDFLYFYQKDPKHYVYSIWASWDVIPNIAERVPDYVLRTACALLTLNLRKDHPHQVTLDQLTEQLKSIPDGFQDSEYIKKALALIQQNPDKLINDLKKRENLVRIVRFFLYSPEVQKCVFRDDVSDGKIEGGRTRGSYPMKWLEFAHQLPENPLRFIARYAVDAKSDHARTSWLLHYLAFAPHE